jgi:hypothetical protein
MAEAIRSQWGIIAAGIVLVGIGILIGIFIGMSAFVSPKVGPHGAFVGDLSPKWLEDGRFMELVTDFRYVDPRDTVWLSPKGSKVNGASIPKILWSVVGGPFEGKYRKASVIHDVACDEMKRPHQEVHRAFYDACLCEGLDPSTARKLYAAVALFGPKWTFESEHMTKEVKVQRFVSEMVVMQVTQPDGSVKEVTKEVFKPVAESRTMEYVVEVPIRLPMVEPTTDDLKKIDALADGPIPVEDFSTFAE